MSGKPGLILAMAASLICPLGHCNDTAAEMLDAPFANDIAMRQFSDDLMTLLGDGDLEQAQKAAIANSHLDDPVAQKNLDEAFKLLTEKLDRSAKIAADYVQTSKFGRSFLRHQYALEAPDFAMRCMATYRRKTDGWRLNQLWCH